MIFGFADGGSRSPIDTQDGAQTILKRIDDLLRKFRTDVIKVCTKDGKDTYPSLFLVPCDPPFHKPSYFILLVCMISFTATGAAKQSRLAIRALLQISPNDAAFSKILKELLSNDCLSTENKRLEVGQPINQSINQDLL